MPVLGALGRRCASVATRTGANIPVRALLAIMFCQTDIKFVDPGHGWKAMNKVYNVSLEATGLPTNNGDII